MTWGRKVLFRITTQCWLVVKWGWGHSGEALGVRLQLGGGQSPCMSGPWVDTGSPGRELQSVEKWISKCVPWIGRSVSRPSEESLLNRPL